MRVETSDGEIIDVLPVGTRVRHTKHPQFTGRIVRHERHESGKVSPLPYCVYWDQPDPQCLLGWFSIYPMRSEVEEVQ